MRFHPQMAAVRRERRLAAIAAMFLLATAAPASVLAAPAAQATPAAQTIGTELIVGKVKGPESAEHAGRATYTFKLRNTGNERIEPTGLITTFFEGNLVVPHAPTVKKVVNAKIYGRSFLVGALAWKAALPPHSSKIVAFTITVKSFDELCFGVALGSVRGRDLSANRKCSKVR